MCQLLANLKTITKMEEFVYTLSDEKVTLSQ